MKVSKKLYVLIALLSSSQLKTAACADVLTVDQLNDYSSTFYNSLVSSEEADQQLKQKEGFDTFLSEAMRLIESEQQEWGIRLIHRHGDVHDDEKMVEEFMCIDGDAAFVTVPKPLESQAYPASWIVHGKSLKVFEFSTDVHVQENVERIVQSPAAFLRLVRLIKHFNLEELLAPAIVGRSTADRFDTSIPLVEHTYDTPFRSIVKNETLKPEQINITIQTLWSKPVTLACISGAYCIPYGGGHHGKGGHVVR